MKVKISMLLIVLLGAGVLLMLTSCKSCQKTEMSVTNANGEPLKAYYLIVKGDTPWYYHFSISQMLNNPFPVLLDGLQTEPVASVRGARFINFYLLKSSLPLTITLRKNKKESIFKIDKFEFDPTYMDDSYKTDNLIVQFHPYNDSWEMECANDREQEFTTQYCKQMKE